MYLFKTSKLGFGNWKSHCVLDRERFSHHQSNEALQSVRSTSFPGSPPLPAIRSVWREEEETLGTRLGAGYVNTRIKFTYRCRMEW